MTEKKLYLGENKNLAKKPAETIKINMFIVR